MLKKIIIIPLLIYNYIPAKVYNVTAPIALNIIQQADHNICVFINLDIYDLPSLYTRKYKDIFKHLHKTSVQQYHQVKALLNKVMQPINPLYSVAHGLAPHIIGITRRSLSWSHLVRATCYEQNVRHTPTRYQITLPSDTPDIPETNRYIELNTNILYIDDNNCAWCITRYLHDTQIVIHGIIYVDTHEQEVHKCVTELQQHMPDAQIIGLCIPNEQLQLKNAELADFNNYLEQLYMQIGQDTVEQKLKIINDEIDRQKAKINNLEQMCLNP